jgi:hypothetical protein
MFPRLISAGPRYVSLDRFLAVHEDTLKDKMSFDTLEASGDCP